MTAKATPNVRSYHVGAIAADLAPCFARLAAKADGFPNWQHALVIHVERIELGLYEVVIADGTTTPAVS